MDQVFGAEGAARSRVVLNLGPWRYLFAAIFLGVGYFTGQQFREEIGRLPATSDPIQLATAPFIVIVYEAYLLCAVIWAVRASTIIRGDVIQVRGVVRQRRAARADIAGYTFFGGQHAFLELHLRTGGRFRAYLFPFYSGRKKLEYVNAWLEGVPDLDVIEGGKFRRELDKRGLLERRLREIGRFERLAKRADNAGIALIFSIFIAEGAFIWKPLEPVWRVVGWFSLTAPFLSFALLVRARRLFSAGDADVTFYSGYPGFVLTMMGGFIGVFTLIFDMAPGFGSIMGSLTPDAATLMAAAVGAVLAPLAWLALRPSQRLPMRFAVTFVALSFWGAGLGAQLATLAQALRSAV